MDWLVYGVQMVVNIGAYVFIWRELKDLRHNELFHMGEKIEKHGQRLARVEEALKVLVFGRKERD